MCNNVSSRCGGAIVRRVHNTTQLNSPLGFGRVSVSRGARLFRAAQRYKMGGGYDSKSRSTPPWQVAREVAATVSLGTLQSGYKRYRQPVCILSSGQPARRSGEHLHIQR